MACVCLFLLSHTSQPLDFSFGLVILCVETYYPILITDLKLTYLYIYYKSCTFVHQTVKNKRKNKSDYLVHSDSVLKSVSGISSTGAVTNSYLTSAFLHHINFVKLVYYDSVLMNMPYELFVWRWSLTTGSSFF